jgi:hypothetical protein
MKTNQSKKNTQMVKDFKKILKDGDQVCNTNLSIMYLIGNKN